MMIWMISSTKTNRGEEGGLSIGPPEQEGIGEHIA